MDENDLAGTIGENVAASISTAIETAQTDINRATETAEHIARAAMETENGRRLNDMERQLAEWQNQQLDTSEAIAALTIGLTEISAKLSMLTPQQPQTPNLSENQDGQKENQEPEIVVKVEEPEAGQQREPEKLAPKKKRKLWI